MSTDPTLISRAPALETSAVTRAVTVFLLYAGQGIPIGLFDFAIPAWMAVNGASAQDIAFVVGMIGIPWSFKFAAGSVMDRYTWLAMGRRRAWIIGAQGVMVALLLLFAIIDPAPQDVLLLGIVALAVNTATVFQDVAVDALTVDMVPEAERSTAGALSSGGQVIGIAASASFTGAMVYAFGASAAYMACAFLVALVTAHVIWVRERLCERRLPWSAGRAHEATLSAQAAGWLPLAKSAFRNTLSPITLLWCPVLVTRGLAYGVCVIAVPLIASQHTGWAEDRIGSLNGTAQLIAGIATIAIGALLAARLGAQRFLLIGTIALMMLVAWMWSSSGSWSDPAVITTFVMGWTILYFLGGVGEIVTIMRLSPASAAASQYSVFMAFHNMGISLAGLLIGSVAALAEPEGMLALLIGSQLLAAIILLTVKFPTERIPDPLGLAPTAPLLAAAPG
jgi:MFS transporter, PAT family, beta-lactamase induction signal transducer AmpG